MHYDDLEYDYSWDNRRWDEEPKAVTSLAEKRYQFDKIDHVTQGAYKFRDANGLFWVPKYEITAPANLQPLTKVKVLNICNVNGELYAVCEDGRVRSFDFDENEWIDLPAILK